MGQQQPTAVEEYVRGFRARVVASRRPGQELVDEPGIVGLIGRDPRLLDGRVLVTDDRAVGVFTELLPRLRARAVVVLADAAACHARAAGAGVYRPRPCTAMVCGDLATIPDLDLVDGLALRPVSPDGDRPEEVPLRQAAAAALRADPSERPDLDGFVRYLRGVPDARFHAAVDEAGVVRATAATTHHGDCAGVFFVNTDPGWRGRGVGTAMTGAAFRAAAAGGATRAHLNASASGRSIYLRLGFRAVGEATMFVDER